VTKRCVYTRKTSARKLDCAVGDETSPLCPSAVSFARRSRAVFSRWARSKVSAADIRVLGAVARRPRLERR
jgi:hypothetical protein